MHYKKGKPDDEDVAIQIWTTNSKSEAELETIQYPAESNEQGKVVVIHPSLLQRTPIFQALDSKGHRVVVKETYRSTGRPFWDPRVLLRVHATGEVPRVGRQRLHNIPGLPH